MKKILLAILCLVSAFHLKAQDLDKKEAYDLIIKNMSVLGITEADVENSILTNAYPAFFQTEFHLQSQLI